MIIGLLRLKRTLNLFILGLGQLRYLELITIKLLRQNYYDKS